MVRTDEEFQRHVETCREIELYFVIDAFGAFIWRMEHDMAHGRIPQEAHPGIDKDVLRCRERSVVAAAQVVRFGVDPPTDENSKPTADYWRWYKWWDNWKKGLADAEWDVINGAFSRGLTDADATLYRPDGRWQDTEAPEWATT